MKKTDTKPTDYISTLPADDQATLKELHEKFSHIFKGQLIVMWEGVFWGGSEQNIIGYGDMRYERPGKPTVEWFDVGLTKQKNYFTVFVNGVVDGQYLAEKFKEQLGKVKVGKSSISFGKLDDVNKEALLELVQTARDMAGSK